MNKLLLLAALLLGTAAFAAAEPAAADTLFRTEPDLPQAELTRNWSPDGRTVVKRPDGTVCVTEHYKRRDRGSFFMLFFEGGSNWMTLITLLLFAQLLAAWKRPECVRLLGTLALCVGLLSLLFGCFSVCSLLRTTDVSDGILWAGIRVGLIAPIYGLAVCSLSLVIRLLQKPQLL